MRKPAVSLGVLAALIVLSGPAMTVSAWPTSAPPPPPPPPPTVPVDPLTAQLQAAEAQQAQLAATKTSLSAEVTTAKSEQANLVALVAANQKAIGETLAKLAAAEQRYHDANALESQEHATADAARIKAHQDRALLALYVRMRYSGNNDALTFIFSGGSLSDLFNRSAAVGHIEDSSNQLVVSVQQDVDNAVAAEARAKADADAAATAVASLGSLETQLQQQTTTAQHLIGQLDAQTQAATQEIAQANTQDLALAQQIAATRIGQLDELIAAAEQDAWKSAELYIQAHIGTLPTSITSPLPASSAHFIWAAPGTFITQGFGPSPLPFEPAFGGFPHFHTGIDMAGNLDTPILAAGDGVVVSALAGSTGYGNHIIIAHAGGILTLYGHLDKVEVQAGDAVHQGQEIGLMGSTGNSTGPHLHFEVRVQNQPVDPLPLLPPLPPGANGPPKLVP